MRLLHNFQFCCYRRKHTSRLWIIFFSLFSSLFARSLALSVVIKKIFFFFHLTHEIPLIFHRLAALCRFNEPLQRNCINLLVSKQLLNHRRITQNWEIGLIDCFSQNLKTREKQENARRRGFELLASLNWIWEKMFVIAKWKGPREENET